VNKMTEKAVCYGCGHRIDIYGINDKRSHKKNCQSLSIIKKGI